MWNPNQMAPAKETPVNQSTKQSVFFSQFPFCQNLDAKTAKEQTLISFHKFTALFFVVFCISGLFFTWLYVSSGIIEFTSGRNLFLECYYKYRQRLYI